LALAEVPADQLPTVTFDAVARTQLHTAIGYSLSYLSTASADKAYARPAGVGFTKAAAIKGLKQLDELTSSASDETTFNAALRNRFRVFKSVGCDGRGTVLFTGYYTPIFNASLTQTGEYRYPLYRRPKDLVSAPTPDGIASQHTADGSTKPYPARAELESSGALKGTELVWLANPVESYIVQVQGSARLRLPSGEIIEVGFDGTNGHPYHGIALDLVSEGKIAKSELNLATVRKYFQTHPDELAGYTNRNPRYIFFTKTSGGPFGSLGRPVTTDLSIATDKSIFPPGALAVSALSNGPARLRLDQDTGGGIRAAGRSDLYMGVGEDAERRAGAQYSEGNLFYLIAKD
jgi:membrane-bound lytic murein transglycosylase A